MGDGSSTSLDQLVQEFVLRLRNGEPVTPESYAEAHPELGERILELFPVLAALEGLKVTPAPEKGAVHIPGQDTQSAVFIGDYEVVRELGRGGMGRVLEVRTAAGERRALKVVHPHLLSREGFNERFLREIRIGERVQHDAVVRTLDSGVAEIDGTPTPYVVLEFVEGDTLRDVLAESGAVSERLARDVGASMAEGLAAVHAAGIVHRDIKPENVIIGPDESVKLMDLGVALVEEEALRLTQTGQFVGSLLYASPEQLRRRDVDARTDLYSMGLVLFELVTGRHAESGGEGSQLTQKLASRRAPRLRDLEPSISPFFESVVEGLLAPDPAARLPDATQVATILREGEQSDWWRDMLATNGQRTRPDRFGDAPSFVGRTDTLAWLDHQWSEARQGRGRVAVLRGGGGVGKSRTLAHWLDRTLQDAPTTHVLWTGHGPEDRVGIAELALPIRMVLGHGWRDRLASWFETSPVALEQAIACMASVVDRTRMPGTGATTAAQMAEASTLALDMLAHLAAERPVIVVVEDLHLARESDGAVFSRLGDLVRDHAIAVVATTRTRDQGVAMETVARLTHGDSHELEPLDRDASLALLDDALGPVPITTETRNALWRLSAGNPFCLLEFARGVRDRAGLDAPGDENIPMPESVRAFAEERLRGLPHEERELLSIAACCEASFDPVVVCTVADLPRLQGLRRLHRIERERGLVIGEGLRYRFKHTVIQETLYAELPPPLKASFHSSLASALTQTGSEEDAADRRTLTRHLLRGEEPEAARPYVLDALSDRLAAGERREVVQLAQRALEIFADEPAAFRASLWNFLGEGLEGLAQPIELREAFTNALDLRRRDGDEYALVAAIHRLGAAISHQGKHEESLPYAKEAYEIAARLDAPALKAQAAGSYADSLYGAGAQEEALRLAREAFDLARTHGEPEAAMRTAMYLAAFQVESGKLEDGASFAELALSASRMYEAPMTERFAAGVLAKIFRTQGNLAGAAAMVQTYADVARRHGNLRHVAGAERSIAALELAEGRALEAARRSDAATLVTERMGYRELSLLVAEPRAMAYSHLGALDKALEAAELGMRLTEIVPLPGIVIRACPQAVTQRAWVGDFEGAEAALAKGRDVREASGAWREGLLLDQAAASLADARGDIDGAILGYVQVAAAFASRGMHLDEACVQEHLGGLYARRGDRSEARRALERSLELSEGGPLPVARATVGVWIDLQPGGSTSRARIALERDAALIPARVRARLWHRLAEATGSDADRNQARTLAEALVAGVPEAWREACRRDVALMREILG